MFTRHDNREHEKWLRRRELARALSSAPNSETLRRELGLLRRGMRIRTHFASLDGDDDV